MAVAQSGRINKAWLLVPIQQAHVSLLTSVDIGRWLRKPVDARNSRSPSEAACCVRKRKMTIEPSSACGPQNASWRFLGPATLWGGYFSPNSTGSPGPAPAIVVATVQTARGPAAQLLRTFERKALEAASPSCCIPQHPPPDMLSGWTDSGSNALIRSRMLVLPLVT